MAAGQHTITLPYNAKVTKVVMYAVGDNNTANKGKITELAGQTFAVDLPSRKSGTAFAQATVENVQITGEFTFTVTYNAGVKFELTVEENSGSGIQTVSANAAGKNGKFLKNGKLVIVRDGKQYTVTGVATK